MQELRKLFYVIMIINYDVVMMSLCCHYSWGPEDDGKQADGPGVLAQVCTLV